MRTIAFALATSVLAIANPAAAQTAVTNLPTGSFPATNDGTTFVAPAVETRANSNGSQSSAKLTATSPISSNGSIEIQGNRSRVYNDMTGLGIAGNTLVSLTGDYQVNNGGAGGIQSPAFRVYLNSTNVVNGFGGSSELIWEAANNGGYTLGQPASVGANDLFWRQIVGSGFDGTGGLATGTYRLMTLSAWGDLLNGTVRSVGVGNGGCPGDCSNFSAFADNLSLTTDSTTRTYDVQAAAAVPEPATWAMMMIGFGVVGASMRRRQRSVKVTFA